MYKRLTQDEYQVQGFYTQEYGWEEVTCENTYKEAKVRLKEYNENEPGVAHRIQKTRVRIREG